ncbi:hypothetical protein EB796_008177 [Bugula neritina]|uniref:Sulfotransferase domain-containing protein n=1 Tax=Bugula neritina TaxID=10212 RepID=A0A7J7K5Q8_BUGNE|nr:hypothetical protein EB796_008177 [Bugula neritina]
MALWFMNVMLFCHCVYLVIYSLFRCCQLVSWWLTGVQSHLKSCRNGNNYESSAQLLRVWFRSSGRAINVNLRHHFLSTHVRFVHPTYALQKNITLMTVTDTEAIFSISDENEDIYDVRKWIFVAASQSVTTKYLLIMPISSMVKLGEELGDPKTKVIWIYHTGRCGSTALCQVFNALPDVVSISEPNCVLSLDQTLKKKALDENKPSWLSSSEYLKIYQNTIRLLLKPYQKEASVFAVKSHGLTTELNLQLIPKLFPDFIGIFMYRNPREQITSLYRVLKGLHPHEEWNLSIIRHPVLSLILPNIQLSALTLAGCNDPKHLQWLFRKENKILSDEFIFAVIQFAETCFHYKEVVGEGAPIVAIKYELFQQNKCKFFEAIFHHSGLELTSEREALIDIALSEDSQKGTPLEKSVLAQKKINITTEMIDNANRYLKYYDLPGWGDSLTLPNTM